MGLPEGQFHLTQAALYLATASKSNSSLGFFDALKSVEAEQAEVPDHVKDASRDKEGFGHGEGYLYPHAFRDHWVAQEYLPESLRGRVFYQPGSLGIEGERRALVLERREAQVAAAFSNEDSGDSGSGRSSDKGLVWSKAGEERGSWRVRAEGGAPERLSLMRSWLFGIAAPLRQDRVLVLDAREGYFVWEALRRASEGTVVALVRGGRERAIVEQYASTLQEIERPIVMEGDPENLDAAMVAGAAGFSAFDLVIGRDLVSRSASPAAALARLAREFPGARFVGAETLAREGGRLSALALTGIGEELTGRFAAFEEGFYGADNTDPALGPTAAAIEEAARASGLEGLAIETRKATWQRRFTADEVSQWFSPASPYGKAAEAAFSPDELSRISRTVVEATRAAPQAWPFSVLYVSARFQSPSAGLDTKK